MNSPAPLLQHSMLSAVSPMSESPSGTAAEKPQYGRDVHKLCDRDAQKSGFLHFFKQKARACPKYPQFYWLHGEADECLDSFIDCLKAEPPIKSYDSVRRVNIPWPRTGSFEERQEMLASEICEPFLLNDITPERLAETLAQHCLQWKYDAVILAHDIHAADWNAQNERFARWYISECWGTLRCHHDMPQFLIFFNMVYPVQHGNSLFARLLRGGSSKARIVEQLRRLHETSGDPDPCQMLEEFRSVQREDVHNWFIKHGYCDETAWLDILNSLFQEQGRPVERRPMSIVQKALEAFVKAQERVMMEREGWGQYSQVLPTPPPRVSDIKREKLEQDLEQYRKQYEAASQQKRHDLNAGNQISLQSQIDDIEQKMRDIEQTLRDDK